MLHIWRQVGACKDIAGCFTIRGRGGVAPHSAGTSSPGSQHTSQLLCEAPAAELVKQQACRCCSAGISIASRATQSTACCNLRREHH